MRPGAPPPQARQGPAWCCVPLDLGWGRPLSHSLAPAHSPGRAPLMNDIWVAVSGRHLFSAVGFGFVLARAWRR